MIARVAWGLARSPLPEHRWRRVAVPLAAAAALLTMLAGASVVGLIRREADRDERRTALFAEIPSPTDLYLVGRDDSWRGEQFAVAWVEPAGDAQPVLPPGMTRLPDPGQAVVSPALDRLCETNPELAARYPNRLVLGADGLRGGGELLAYIRPPAERSLAGDPRAARVAGFGPPTRAALVQPIGQGEPVAVVAVFQGVLGFLVMPGLLVLAAAAAAGSSVRDRRFAVFRSLGMPRRRLLALAVLETMLLALPGLVAAGLLWAVLAPRIGRVPLVGHQVVRGDLGLPWWLLVALFGAGCAITVVVAAAVATVRERGGLARPRPTAGRAVLSPLRVIPLATAAVLIVLFGALGGYVGTELLLSGIVVTIGAVPILLPGAVRPIGAALTRLPSVPALLAGRLLEWDPIRTVRPFTGAAGLIIIALFAATFIAHARYAELPPSVDGGVHAAQVGWLDARPEDFARLRADLGSGLVAPSRFDAEGLLLGSTCASLAPYVNTTCRPDQPYVLPPESMDTVAALALAPGLRVRLAPEGDVATGGESGSGSALVLDREAPGALVDRVRGAAMRLLAAPTVVNQEALAKQGNSPLAAWLEGGLTAALVVLAAGCLVALVDGLLGTRGQRRHLLNLGLTPRRLAALEAWLFLAPYGATVAAGFAVGLVNSVLVASLSGIPLPREALGATVAIAVAVALLGTAGVVLFGARSVLEQDHR